MKVLKIFLLVILILILIFAFLAIRKQSEENRQNVRDSLGFNQSQLIEAESATTSSLPTAPLYLLLPPLPEPEIGIQIV